MESYFCTRVFRVTRWLFCFVALVSLGAACSSNEAEQRAGRTSTASNAPSARLYNFDSKSRIAGHFIIGFKNDSRLAEVQTAGNPPDVLPDVLPDSKRNIERLAAALASTSQREARADIQRPPAYARFPCPMFLTKRC